MLELDNHGEMEVFVQTCLNRQLNDFSARTALPAKICTRASLAEEPPYLLSLGLVWGMTTSSNAVLIVLQNGSYQYILGRCLGRKYRPSLIT